MKCQKRQSLHLALLAQCAFMNFYTCNLHVQYMYKSDHCMYISADENEFNKNPYKSFVTSVQYLTIIHRSGGE